MQYFFKKCTAFYNDLFILSGTTHGGLHFPQDKFKFTGEVAKQEERLEAEIKEWQTRMQEYLVEAAKQQQQQNTSDQTQQSVQQPQPPQHQLQQSGLFYYFFKNNNFYVKLN